MKALENNKGIPQVDLATAIREGDRQAAADILRQQAKAVSYSPEFREYLADSTTALETNNWEGMANHLLHGDYIDDRGNIFILAPYLRRINGQDVTQLTLLEGKICSYSPVKMEAAAIEVFGTLNQEIPQLLVVDVEIAVGNIGNEESFIAPGGWVL